MLRLVECVEALAFDLDGTLIDTAPDLTAAANMMLMLLGGRPLPQERIAALIGGGVETLVARALEESSRRSDVGPQLQAAATALFKQLYEQHLFDRSRIYPGVVEALDALENAALPLCCITNKESRFTLPLLEAAGLRHRFAAVVCADCPEDRKPSPSMLLTACRQIGVGPGNLLYIGDAPGDVAAARAAKCRVVAVSYGYTAHHLLTQAQPDGVVGNLIELITNGLRSRASAPQLRVVS